MPKNKYIKCYFFRMQSGFRSTSILERCILSGEPVSLGRNFVNGTSQEAPFISELIRYRACRTLPDSGRKIYSRSVDNPAVAMSAMSTGCFSSNALLARVYPPVTRPIAKRTQMNIPHFFHSPFINARRESKPHACINKCQCPSARREFMLVESKWNNAIYDEIQCESCA